MRLAALAITAALSCAPEHESPAESVREPIEASAMLATAIAEGDLPPALVVEAWLERDNDRRGLPPGTVARAFDRRVTLASQFVRGGAISTSAHLAALKQELLARRDLRYNRDASTVADFLLDDRVQCFSGSVMVVLAWITTARDVRARPVLVHTRGHVQPGLLVGGTLITVEATANDAAVSKRRLARVEAVRVTDAVAELALELLEDAPPWLRERASILDAAPGARRASGSPDRSVFGFGDADIPAGDRPLLARKLEPSSPVPSGSERLAQPRVSVQSFKLAFCEDVFPWNQSERGELRALERDLRRILAKSDLEGVRVHLAGDCALVGEVPGFDFGNSSPVRLLAREQGGWTVRQRATLETLQVPHNCQLDPPWQFCALKQRSR